MKILAALLLFPVVLGVKQLCPSKTASCPDSSTCCQLPNLSYGCCPLENAVCCDDHIHCCPAGTKCSTGMCVQSTNSSILASKTNDIVCPDKEATCPAETTCCMSPPGQSPTYECCPMADAVCCNDGLHCCPTGTTCDVAAGKCLGDRYVTEMYRKKPHVPQKGLALIRMSSDRVTNIVCPGAGFQCPDLTTCCKLQSGDWGCCPFANAECCEDKIHCCPETMHCDATSQYCSQGNAVNVTALRKVPATKIAHKVQAICPDKTQCGAKDTCCEIRDGKFGCCPYSNATCCSDRLHCCPSGSRCDVKLMRCIKEGWLSDALNEIFHKL